MYNDKQEMLCDDVINHLMFNADYGTNRLLL